MRLRLIACLALLSMVACRSTPTHPATAPGQRKPPSQGTIHVGDFLATPNNCGMVHGPRPRYPKQARQAHVEGVVKFDIVISKTGEVTEVRLVFGNPKLVSAAMDVVKKWRYAPCRLNGEPIEVKTLVDVSFTLTQ